jgi:hypothetical protein
LVVNEDGATESLLTRQQSQRVHEVAKKQEETHEQVQIIAGDGQNYCARATGRSGGCCLQCVKMLQGERQKFLKAELHDELLSEDVQMTGLRPTAPPTITIYTRVVDS